MVIIERGILIIPRIFTGTFGRSITAGAMEATAGLASGAGAGGLLSSDTAGIDAGRTAFPVDGGTIGSSLRVNGGAASSAGGAAAGKVSSEILAGAAIRVIGGFISGLCT